MISYNFVPREAPSSEIYNFVAREARVYHSSIARPAWFPLGYKSIEFGWCPPWRHPVVTSKCTVGFRATDCHRWLETHSALWRHYWMTSRRTPTKLDRFIAKRKSRWPCDAWVIHARFARDEIINLAARRFARNDFMYTEFYKKFIDSCLIRSRALQNVTYFVPQ